MQKCKNAENAGTFFASLPCTTAAKVCNVTLGLTLAEATEKVKSIYQNVRVKRQWQGWTPASVRYTSTYTKTCALTV